MSASKPDERKPPPTYKYTPEDYVGFLNWAKKEMIRKINTVNEVMLSLQAELKQSLQFLEQVQKVLLERYLPTLSNLWQRWCRFDEQYRKTFYEAKKPPPPTEEKKAEVPNCPTCSKPMRHPPADLERPDAGQILWWCATCSIGIDYSGDVV